MHESELTNQYCRNYRLHDIKNVTKKSNLGDALTWDEVSDQIRYMHGIRVDGGLRGYLISKGIDPSTLLVAASILWRSGEVVRDVWTIVDALPRARDFLLHRGERDHRRRMKDIKAEVLAEMYEAGDFNSYDALVRSMNEADINRKVIKWQRKRKNEIRSLDGTTTSA